MKCLFCLLKTENSLTANTCNNTGNLKNEYSMITINLKQISTIMNNNIKNKKK